MAPEDFIASTLVFEKSYHDQTKHLDLNARYGIPDKTPMDFNENAKSPIKRQHSGLYPLIKYGAPYDYDVYMDRSIDQVNNYDLVKTTDFTPFDFNNFIDTNPSFYYPIKDFIPFYFESLHFPNESTQRMKQTKIFFRAFISDVNDQFKAGYNKFKYNGRAESFYTNKDFDRTLSFSFKIAAFSRHEMQPLYRKLNYLVSNTAPEYDNDSGRIKTPFMRVTIGDWISELPGFLTSISLKWGKDYPWEIRAGRDRSDRTQNTIDDDMLVLPHVLDVSVNFQPIHNFLPQRDVKSPFILPQAARGMEFTGNSNGSINNRKQYWLSYSAWGEKTTSTGVKYDESYNKDIVNAMKAQRNFVPDQTDETYTDQMYALSEEDRLPGERPTIEFGNKSWKGKMLGANSPIIDD